MCARWVPFGDLDVLFVSLSDGRHVVIRPVVPADAGRIEQA